MPSDNLLSLNRRLAFQPDPENVPSRVHVAVVARATVGTIPRSYSDPCDTLRASDASAIGTGSGRESFIDNYKRGLMPSGFIGKLRFQYSPTRIQNGFRHRGLCELSSTDVADANQIVFAGYSARLIMKMMPARIGDLGMDSSNAPLVACPLSNRQSILILRSFGPRTSSSRQNSRTGRGGSTAFVRMSP